MNDLLRPTDAPSSPDRRRDDVGASAVEYGLLIAGIAAVIVVAVLALGPVVKGAFTTTCSSVSSGISASGTTC